MQGELVQALAMENNVTAALRGRVERYRSSEDDMRAEVRIMVGMMMETPQLQWDGGYPAAAMHWHGMAAWHEAMWRVLCRVLPR